MSLDGDFEKIFLRSRFGVPAVIVVVTPWSAVRRESFSVDGGVSLLGFPVFNSLTSGTEFRFEGLGATGAVCVGVEGERVSGVMGATLDPGDMVRGGVEK